MSTKSEDCSSGIWWAINNMFLTGVTDVCGDMIVECRANEGMRIRDLSRPKIKDLTCPRGYIANDAEVVHESIEVSSSGDKIRWV